MYFTLLNTENISCLIAILQAPNVLEQSRSAFITKLCPVFVRSVVLGLSGAATCFHLKKKRKTTIFVCLFYQVCASVNSVKHHFYSEGLRVYYRLFTFKVTRHMNLIPMVRNRIHFILGISHFCPVLRKSCCFFEEKIKLFNQTKCLKLFAHLLHVR